MKYIKHLFAIFRTYQLCGFSPFPLSFDRNHIWGAKHSSDKRHQRWLIYSYSLLVTLFLLVVCNFVYHEIHSDTRVSTMLNYLTFLMFSTMRMLAVFVVFESLLTRNRQMQFLYLLNDVDEILTKDLAVTLDYRRLRQSGLLWLIFWLIKLTSLQTMIFVMRYGRTRSVLSVLLSLWYTIPLFISSMRYYQVTHYIELLGYRFKLLSNYANSICGRKYEIKYKIQTLMSKADHSKRNSDVYNEVVRMRRIHHHLWRATICLNSSFRWSLLLSIGCSFVIVLVNNYRSLLYALSKPDDRAKFGGSSIIIFITWAVFHSIYFVKLSSNCYNVLRKV